MNPRNVTIHFTPFAPGVGEAAIGDRRRWTTYLAVTPELAMAHLCHRLKVEPAEVRVVVAHDDIELRGPSAEAQGPVVLAIIVAGLEVAEILAALAKISAARAAA